MFWFIFGTLFSDYCLLLFRLNESIQKYLETGEINDAMDVAKKIALKEWVIFCTYLILHRFIMFFRLPKHRGVPALATSDTAMAAVSFIIKQAAGGEKGNVGMGLNIGDIGEQM